RAGPGRAEPPRRARCPLPAEETAPTMTYCVGIKLNAGLVFLSDSRTNAGVDNISIFRKMIVYEKPGDRFMVLLSAGNLSISQSVREILQTEKLPPVEGDEATTIWNATSMFDAARVLGSAVRRGYEQGGRGQQQPAVYEADRLQSDRITCIDDRNPYFRMLRDTWGERLHEVFEGMEVPHWGDDSALASNPLIVPARRYDVLRKIRNPDEKIV